MQVSEFNQNSFGIHNQAGKIEFAVCLYHKSTLPKSEKFITEAGDESNIVENRKIAQMLGIAYTSFKFIT